jgi:hypothetical protein
MSIRATGPGTGSVVLDRRPTYLAFRLGNFDIEGDKMKAEHIQFIENEVLPWIRSPRFIEARLGGLTSRTGSFSYDFALGRRRSADVEKYLYFRLAKDGVSALPISNASYSYELALGKSDIDGSEDRAVIIEIFMAHRAPPPPPTPRPDNESDNIPAYVKTVDGTAIPMYLVPHGTRLITQNADNRLTFFAGQVVDCYIAGFGAAVVTIAESGTKKSIEPTVTGVGESFTKFGQPPIPWTFDFKPSSTIAIKAGVDTVTCYSDWITGMPTE